MVTRGCVDRGEHGLDRAGKEQVCGLPTADQEEAWAAHSQPCLDNGRNLWRGTEIFPWRAAECPTFQKADTGNSDGAFTRGDPIFTHCACCIFFSLLSLSLSLSFYILSEKTHLCSPHGTATARVPVGSHTESFPQCSHRCHPYKGEGYVHIRQCLKGKNVRFIKAPWGKHVHTYSTGEGPLEVRCVT